MSLLSSFTLSNLRTSSMIALVSETHFPPPWTNNLNFSQLPNYRKQIPTISSLQTTLVGFESEENVHVEEQPKIRWEKLSPELTEEHAHSISRLSPKLSKRCKALMKQIITFSPQEGNLALLLSSWVRTMTPRRCDWLVILKEMKKIDSSLLFEVMEYALIEDSFEANIRDYTKLIDAYGKENRLQDAENAFSAMERRGFSCDQVTLTVLIHMYSKAGGLNRAKETFDKIKLLSVPIDKRAYGAMVMAYIRAGKPEHGETLLLEMDRQETYACREVYKALLRAYSSAGNTGGAQRVFDAIQFAGIVPDAKLCTLLVNAYCVAGQTDNARSAFENMKQAGLRPTDKCVALMLTAYEKENKLEKAMALLAELEREGVLLGNEASEVFVQWFQRLGLAEDVVDVLNESVKKE